MHEFIERRVFCSLKYCYLLLLGVLFFDVNVVLCSLNWTSFRMVIGTAMNAYQRYG